MQTLISIQDKQVEAELKAIQKHGKARSVIINQWSIWQRVSPRFAVQIGKICCMLDYAIGTEDRLNANWRKGYKRRHTRTFMVTMSSDDIFRDGW